MLTNKISIKWLVTAIALAIVIPMAMILAEPEKMSKPETEQKWLDKSGDEELAYLLVKLEKRTRAVIAGHYGRIQDGGSDETLEYKEALIRNGILPAAVADPIFAETVPKATSGRAWVKMVVPEPRNPNNIGDDVALEILAELKQGAESVWRNAYGAVYYGEPIMTNPGCFTCHGAPAGEPDPYFSQYKKNGWEPGEVVGGVIARVAPE
jgi:hypothetical protein